jgi:vancomycin aglycone glucosyltransferase
MRVLLSTYGSRGNVETMVEFAVQPASPRAQVRMSAPPDCAAAEECDAPVATGVMPTGGWR